jgi:hypothetical protein
MNLIKTRQGELTVLDYNRDEEWAPEAVAQRYAQYCDDFGWVRQSALVAEDFTDAGVKRIWPIMTPVNIGIKKDDPACTEIGIDFICDSRSFPFGMTLKSNTARALRKATLTERQQDRIRERVATMLLDGYLPQEYKFYARLLRRTGLGQFRDTLLAVAPRGHRMTRYFNYVQGLAAEGC